jgi:UPF0176 protein
MITVAALYQFKDFPTFKEQQAPLREFCFRHGIKGTLLLAHEGINGTVSGDRAGIDALQDYLVNTLGFDRLEYKESEAKGHPFYRLKIKLKKEIVTLGKPGEANPSVHVGTYLDAQAWNKLIQEPDVFVVDTRNEYEYQIGTFKDAVNPHIQTFREFPAFVQKNMDPAKHKRVAMFCTGGIRCEKSTAYMLSQGYEEVYHLKGGILKYLEETPPEQSLWEGECFVFDQRVALEHGVGQGQYHTCHGCRMPITAADQASPLYEDGVSCPHCHASLTPERATRLRERQKQIVLAAARGVRHMGRVAEKRAP